MIPRVLLSLAVVSTLTAFAPAPFPRPKRKPNVEGGLAVLQGTWTVTRTRPGADGVRIEYPPMKLRVEGNRWTFLRQVEGEWHSSVTYLITVDDRHNPRHIDLVRDHGNVLNVNQTTLKGIYAVEGNTVKFLYVLTRASARGRGANVDRPTSFDSPLPRAILLTLTRDK
jgi:uncharacterized protein (TIGR03067 family)